jgi:BirA family biotin operon repressor/biotin-[acetyl-CoA-carboxylase] ligase
VDSTNDELRRLAERGAVDRSVVVAGEQSAGRGRLGRTWHSPPGSGLYLSVLFRWVRDGPRATRWTLGGAVAACLACRRESGCAVEIDWPNDLVFGGRKLGGILAELRGGSELILGAGINVTLAEQELPRELAPRATSLAIASGRIMLERERLAAEYLRELGRVAGRLRGGRWSEVARAWLELAPGARDRRVRVLSPTPLAGTTAGIDEGGALLVELEDGTTRAVRMVDAVVPAEE